MIGIFYMVQNIVGQLGGQSINLGCPFLDTSDYGCDVKCACIFGHIVYLSVAMHIISA